MIDAALRTAALADATLSGLVGTRVYPVKLPQDPTYPAVTYQRISGPRLYTHEGATGMAEGRWQFDVWAETYSDAQSVSSALRDALEAVRTEAVGGVTISSVFVINEQSMYEPAEGDTGDWRVSVDLWVRYYE